MRLILPVVLLTAYLLLIGSCTPKQTTENKTPSYQLNRLTSELTIDGRITETDWNQVSWAGDFTQTDPNSGAPPHFATEFKLLYDSLGLYAAFRCYDNLIDSIDLSFQPRDFSPGDWVEINIDGDLDREDAFSFTLSASGVRGDEWIQNNGENWVNDWQPEWEMATQITDYGWAAEAHIPLSQLGLKSVDTQAWGIQVNRKLARRDEFSSWVYIPDDDNWVSNFGTATGISGLDPSVLKHEKTAYYPFTVEALVEDYEILINALRNVYPSLYRYNSVAQIDEQIMAIQASLKSPLTELEFLQRISPLLSKLGDGHLDINLSKTTQDYLEKERPRFPVSLYFEGDKAIVMANYGDNKFLKPGDQLLRIDGMPIQAIVNELILLLMGDGQIEIGKRKQLAENFGYYYDLQYGSKEELEIEYLSGHEIRPKKTWINNLYATELNQRIAAKKTSFPGDLEFEITKENTAYLAVRSFGEQNDFQAFMDSAFTAFDAANIGGLIIDVRGNGGGSEENGIYLLSYLVDKDFYYFDRYEVGAFAKPSTSLYYPGVDDRETMDFFRRRSTKDENGRWVINRFDDFFLIDPSIAQASKSNAFLGELLVLIDGESFSATAEFCALIDDLDRGRFVGEETAGTYDGNTSGMKCALILPNSGLRLELPMIKYVCAVPVNDENYARGVLPDFEIQPTVTEMLSGKDPVLDLSWSLLSE